MQKDYNIINNSCQQITCTTLCKFLEINNIICYNKIKQKGEYNELFKGQT